VRSGLLAIIFQEKIAVTMFKKRTRLEFRWEIPKPKTGKKILEDQFL
jgi:hypothetical protein